MTDNFENALRMKLGYIETSMENFEASENQKCLRYQPENWHAC